MTKSMKRNPLLPLQLAVITALSLVAVVPAQKDKATGKQRVRTVSIPISIYSKDELRRDQADEFVQVDRLVVNEDNDEQEILAIRSVTRAPLALAVLIQEDLTSSFNLQLRDLAAFIRNLPQGSRVMVAYLRGGSLQIRQRFTDDLNRAAGSLRIVAASESSAPRNPYDGLVDTLDRFDALPAGRRAILLVSDGLDVSQGTASTSPTQSTDLERAIRHAQLRSVSVYCFYSPASLTENGNSRFITDGQSSLLRLSDATGGRAFFQGTIAPVSYQPFFKDLNILLNRQFLLTYMSTHMNKGYHRIDVTSTNPAVKIEHPKGYYYR